ncbi:DNA polymerase III subunit psi [Necropsobacter rosorum]|uniref:DNA polymerase III subunit psi n=1 Tax=Necropsobacter rosorum TaxID=908285 RepID=UPI0005093A3A
MNRRDLLLQEMGITQWRLSRPAALKGAATMSVGQNIRLVIIAEQEIAKTHPLLNDILRSIEMPAQDCLCINFDFAPLLNLQHSVHYWLLSDNAQKIDRTLIYCKQALAQWQSPDWPTLQQDPQAKRRLWQQIQRQVD